MRFGIGEGDERESLKVLVGDILCLSAYLQNREAFIFVEFKKQTQPENALRTPEPTLTCFEGVC